MAPLESVHENYKLTVNQAAKLTLPRIEYLFRICLEASHFVIFGL